jgi:putative ABC transport system permease protein
MNFRWLLKMAWRDSRKNRSRLLLFISSIILGIAALVAISSFGISMQGEIEGEAKKLLGADLEVSDRQPFTEKTSLLMDSLGGEQSKEVSFASMVLFPKNYGTRLVQVRGLEGNYPYYGNIETVPTEAAQSFREQKAAIVDNTLMLQFDTEIGDSIKVGSLIFPIIGRINKVPGQTGVSTSVAPIVYIPMRYMEATGLMQKGSRINYKTYFKFDPGTDVEAMMENWGPKLRELEMGFDTVEERKQEMGETYANLTGFLNLVAFVALLLGCIGVASAIHIYVREKLATVAILRCLGAKGIHAFLIYLIQIAIMGLAGSLVGAFLGSMIQFVLPKVFAGFLPVEVDLSISWFSIFMGIGIGLLVSILFALVPLLAVRHISPLRALRSYFEEDGQQRDVLKYAIYLMILLLVYLFSYGQLQDWVEASFFTGGILVAFFLLAAVAKGVMWMVRQYFPTSWGYAWRQGLSNLYRPNNQTLILIVAIGLGTALISTLYFVQNTLLEQVKVTGGEGQGNMVLFDIQSDQEEEIVEITKEFDLPIMQRVPIITMRIAEIKGKSLEDIKEDTTSDISSWVLTREYRVTYRDSLIDSEKIVNGNWQGKVNSPADSIFVSIDEEHARRMHVDIGDKVTFNVQGAYIDTYVGSFREVDWRKMQTNFLILFPEGVLEKAPKFHVLITRVNSDEVAANYQKAVVRTFPNVSIIDLKLILKTVNGILDKVTFVIQFMALFSIFTGILVLIGSVILSKFQRLQESVLLRTLGASRKQILTITALEYFFLGSLAALTGVIIALAGSYGLTRFSFEVGFSPTALPVLITFVLITALTMFIGIMSSRSVLNSPPLEVLRKEI